ncbi:hypothetical protein EZV62_024428 [Acer yangbiense]|uniref:Uncharacterized protein n=1 Tax=Acer yangbiense TaxID=1000413 RepID=A0A5C7GV40_9ROSI|nr:hypothetical protein EZV62_024428 [Acer yangbiense]
MICSLLHLLDYGVVESGEIVDADNEHVLKWVATGNLQKIEFDSLRIGTLPHGSHWKGFMAITAHFVDNSWTLQNRIIRFIYVPCPHTSEMLADVMMACLHDWNIEHKLSTLTVDNCSTNNAMIRILFGMLFDVSLLLNGDMFHMRYSTHILNLIVRDGLDVSSASVERIRSSVSYWISSPKREEKNFVTVN